MNSAEQKILVWDAPVRVFHWLMVLSFAGAYLTADSERWRLVHVSLGYTMGGLVAFRLVWGLVGSRHARFRSFVTGPAALLRYGRSLLGRQPEHFVGHNPAGAVAIVLLLLSSMVIVGSGWAIYNDAGPAWLARLHEAASTFMLVVVLIHITGVVVASLLHHENLVRAMVDGQKSGTAQQAIRWRWRPLAALMVAAVLGFWWYTWQGAPAGLVVGFTGSHVIVGAGRVPLDENVAG
ncbi:MAG: cytochrome B [Polaromonas sp. 39-63-203]|jgi:cytochrome b|uniref:cytochrome b/b6 domain-containing protein n=1 Tax=Polaromonas sp. TaxID=1869339 RepID=UPI000BDBAF5A|nr:cytochrome b/b6 domain-containing protein [Polaromonas sp.]OYY52713.1 MAG: cytochrome B [Polaromonas sp. 35-63-240]OYY96458.1 MAG: cytochrome B [Polaromonas sp. 28-63-22]OYZ84374.1 MAG: cytochrome B [Polaromonas sp. 24-62-144]OZA98633.1 MAG: cytochrome B [Polaromonas sp. 39-63-203]HQS32485.1 cytochrome b/b6 domain-containing protein [Polaromonas sp.]